MLSQKDLDFLTYLSTATDTGKIPWQPTAADDQFTASLRGKYSVLVGTGRDGPWLRMSNDQGQVMLFITSMEDPGDRVERILGGARRVALNVDTAIDEIIQEE
jgi:hypothetical protein